MNSNDVRDVLGIAKLCRVLKIVMDSSDIQKIWILKFLTEVTGRKDTI